MHHFSALIAEDEPLLAAALQAELAALWPELKVLTTVGDGASAVREALRLQPDVIFFDIKMPGQSGLDAAIELADAWADVQAPGNKAFPALVFATAYDQFAVQAFEAQAIDYVLKPVQTARLQKTVAKVQQVLAQRAKPAIDFEAALSQLRALSTLAMSPGLSGAASSGALDGSAQSHADMAPLKFIQASVGASVRMVPIDEVVCFEAADKYLRVLTQTGGQPREYLIRTPLKELVSRLDAQIFWQVHRGTLVRASSIEAVTRDEAGKLWLQLRGSLPSAPKMAVSRLYAHLFKAM